MELKIPSNEETRMAKLIYALKSGSDISAFLPNFDAIVTDLYTRFKYSDEKFEMQFINEYFPTIVDIFLNLFNQNRERYKLILKSLSNCILMFKYMIFREAFTLKKVFENILNKENKIYLQDDSGYRLVVQNFIESVVLQECIERLKLPPPPSMQHLESIADMMFRMKPYLTIELFGELLNSFLGYARNYSFPPSYKDTSVFFQLLSYLDNSGPAISTALNAVKNIMMSNFYDGIRLYELLIDFTKKEVFIDFIKTNELHKYYLAGRFNIKDVPKTFNYFVQADVLTSQDLEKIFEYNDIFYLATSLYDRAREVLHMLPQQKVVDLLQYQTNFSQELVETTTQYPSELLIGNVHIHPSIENQFYELIQKRIIENKEFVLLDILLKCHCNYFTHEFRDLIYRQYKTNEVLKNFLIQYFETTESEMPSEFITAFMDANLFSYLDMFLLRTQLNAFSNAGFKFVNTCIQMVKYPTAPKDQIKFIVDFIIYYAMKQGEISPDFVIETFPISNMNILVHAYQVTPPEIAQIPHDALITIMKSKNAAAYDVLFYYLNQANKPFLKLKILELFRDLTLELEQNMVINEYDVYRFIDPYPKLSVLVRFPNGFVLQLAANADSSLSLIAKKVFNLTGLTVTCFIHDQRKIPPNSITISDLKIPNQGTINVECTGTYQQPFIPCVYISQKDLQSIIFQISTTPDFNELSWELLAMMPASPKITPEMILPTLKDEIPLPYVRYLLKCALNMGVQVVAIATKYMLDPYLTNESLDCIMAFPEEFDQKNFNLFYQIIDNERTPYVINAVAKIHPDLANAELSEVICNSLQIAKQWNSMKIIAISFPSFSDDIVQQASMILSENYSESAKEAIALLWQGCTVPTLLTACKSLDKYDRKDCNSIICQILVSGRITANDADSFIGGFIKRGVATLQDFYFISACKVAEYHSSATFNAFLQSISEYKVAEWNYDTKVVKKAKVATGLRNLGATCYLNAVIQQLLYLPTIFAEINELQPSSLWIDHLQELMREMKLTNKQFSDPSKIIEEFNGFGTKLDPHEQQDASEFLLSLLNALPIRKHFECKIIDDDKGDDFLILPLSLEKDSLDFSEYIITQWPNILCLQLSRFSFSKENGARCKINKEFTFPLEIDFGKKKYKLNGVINHKGTPDSGHYISFVRKDDHWILINDTESSIVPEDQLLDQIYGKKSKDESAYLIFYVLEGFNDREAHIPSDVVEAIEADNHSYAQKLLAFEDFCFEVMPKASYGTLIAYFANIYIHSRKSESATIFRTALFNKLGAEKTAIFTLSYFLNNVEPAFANIVSQDISKLLMDIIIVCFNLAGASNSLDFATSLLRTFAETASQWRQANYMLPIFDSFLKLNGSIQLAQERNWGTLLAEVCASALSPDRSQTFLENCDISPLLVFLNATATSSTDAHCLRNISQTIGHSPKSVPHFYHSIEHLCGINAVPLAEGCAYFIDGHTIDRKQSLVYSRIVHCQTRQDLEMLYNEAAGIEVSRSAIINQLMKYSASPNIHQTIFAKFSILCVGGLFSDDTDERAAAKSLTECMASQQTVQMMNEILMSTQNPTIDFMRALIICTKKVVDPNSPLPMILEPLMNLLTIDNLRTHKEHLLLLLCYSDERIDSAFYNITKSILELDRQSFPYIASILQYIHPRVVGALFMLEGWRECARTLKDPSQFIDFLRATNFLRALQIAAAVALERRDTQRLSLLAQYLTTDADIQDAAIVAIQANQWSVITQLANSLKNFRIPPQIAASIALQDSHAMALYCEMRDKAAIIQELKNMDDIGGAASAAIAEIDPLEGLAIINRTKEPGTTRILDILSTKNIPASSAEIALKIFIQPMDHARRNFCLRVLKIPGVDPTKFAQRVQFNQLDDIVRVGILLESNPKLVEAYAPYIANLMKFEWYNLAPPVYANDKRTIESAMMALYMKTNANMADALFIQK